jgi:hypothetical protein
VASEATSIGRCDLKLQFTWQCVDARPAPYLNLELICGVPGLQHTDNDRVHISDKLHKRIKVVNCIFETSLKKNWIVEQE